MNRGEQSLFVCTWTAYYKYKKRNGCSPIIKFSMGSIEFQMFLRVKNSIKSDIFEGTFNKKFTKNCIETLMIFVIDK